MKQIIAILGTALLVLMPIHLFAEQSVAYAPVSVPVKPVKLTDDVYYVEGLAGAATEFEGFISNAGFVVTEDGVVLFDALGTPALAWQLRQEIRKITDKPVVKVIVSHYHADHILGLEVFKDEGAEIIAPAEATIYLDSGVGRERLEERSLSLDPWVTEKTRLVPPDVWLNESMTSSREISCLKAGCLSSAVPIRMAGSRHSSRCRPQGSRHSSRDTVLRHLIPMQRSS
ncbi:MAG: MBL fold metallo-hydrolase [Gammaproteobacteria bacterium]